MNDNQKQIEDLALVIRSLADVWQNDREEITVAGATFEQIVEELQSPGVQLSKLIDLAWQGMRYLYEEEHFFLSVKNATMQGVNTIREYLLKGGNISVEDFESSCNLLEKALSGDAESADKIIELDENDQPYPTVETCNSPKENSTGLKGSNDRNQRNHEIHSLNDLASVLMNLGEPADNSDLVQLLTALNQIAENSSEKVQTILRTGSKKLENYLSEGDHSDDPEWFSILSETIEKALEVQNDESWEDSVLVTVSDDKTEAEENLNINPDSDQSPNQSDEAFLLPDDIDLDMIKEFVAECNDLIEAAESALLDLEDSPEDSELINMVFRAFHTIKGTSAFMGLDPISEFTHYAETLLSMVRDGELSFDRACADISLDSIDIIKKLLAIVSNSGGGDPLPTSENYKRITLVLNYIAEDHLKPVEALQKAGVHVDEPTVNVSSVSEPVKTEIPASDVMKSGQESPVNGVKSINGIQNAQSNKSDQESTVRVNLGRLDRLIDMVGELVIAHSVVSQDTSITKDSELMKKIDHTSKILRELQDTSLTLRMVPLKATFHKMNRLVRDLTRKAGKEVKLSTIGDETEIDRNMVDIINEPLVHMLRNSIDHGVESPDVRAKSGKHSVATVWLRAYQEGGKVVIEIEDDGKGIDKEKILKKAIDKGLVNSDKRPSDKEICGLIFHPGLSSADKVTDLSGRGVGMDVVRRSIDQLQGKVEVESEDGEGTKVTLELPFTLAITDGMLVRVGEQRFIIPTTNIDMTFRSKLEDIFTIMGSTEHVKYRGKSVPIIRLHKLFSVPSAKEDLEGGTLVVVKSNEKLYALLVDEIIGQQQLVGKSINMNVKMPLISGGAILGDGRVGLILDTAAVTAY